MGIEYKILIARPSRLELDRAIRESRFFRDFDEKHQLYNLWQYLDDPRIGMPDAIASVEDYGIYFCDNCANAVSIKESMFQLAMRFDPVATIEEI